MGIEGGSLREVLDGATLDELRSVLLALEGRVVHVGKSRTSTFLPHSLHIYPSDCPLVLTCVLFLLTSMRTLVPVRGGGMLPLFRILRYTFRV